MDAISPLETVCSDVPTVSTVAVQRQLQRKLDFLTAIRDRVVQHAENGQTIQQLTLKVFDRRDLVNWLSFGDGWLSLITASDFSRGNLVKSFLRVRPQEDAV